MSRETARKVLEIEAEAIRALIPGLDERFDRAVDLLVGCAGRVVVTGMGKSGLIAQKISATLASTGTPSLFLHPADAIHGDLGRIVKGDVALVLSYSGDTEEILALFPWVKRLGVPLIALTGNPRSALAAAADVHLDVSIRAGGLSSRSRPHRLHHRRPRHGRRLGHGPPGATRVHGGRLRDPAPRGSPGQEAPAGRGPDEDRASRSPASSRGRAMKDVLFEMTRKRLGITTVVDADGPAAGPDLRRRPAPADGAARLHPPRPHRRRSA